MKNNNLEYNATICYNDKTYMFGKLPFAVIKERNGTCIVSDENIPISLSTTENNSMLIKTDGTIIADFKAETLKEKQNAVGDENRSNLIQVCYSQYLHDEDVIICNEEGMWLNLPINPIASELAQTTLLGDVILMKRSDLH